MDDFMIGNDDVEGTNKLSEDIRTILKKGGFQSRNSQAIQTKC